MPGHVCGQDGGAGLECQDDLNGGHYLQSDLSPLTQHPHNLTLTIIYGLASQTPREVLVGLNREILAAPDINFHSIEAKSRK